MWRNWHISLLFILCVVCIAPLAHAQFSAVPDPLQYIVAPENPGPNQTVYIQIQGVGPFLGNATITWQINGKVAQSGVGLTSLAVPTGPIGTATTVHVSIDSPQGFYTHDFIFSPSTVNLLWEADTSTPSFSENKPLYSAGSKVRVIAFPTVMSGRTQLSSGQLSFQWKRNDTLDTGASGLGKNVFTFTGDSLQSGEQVSVDVYYKNNKVAGGEIIIPATDPQVLLYAQDPLRGELLDQAILNPFTLTASEITLRAEPYYFANSSVRKGSITYTWSLNDEQISSPDPRPGFLTLRQTGSGAGAASVGISVQNADSDKFVQFAQSVMTIVFGQTNKNSFGSFFGL
jgi:hypothetical protein